MVHKLYGADDVAVVDQKLGKVVEQLDKTSCQITQVVLIDGMWLVGCMIQVLIVVNLDYRTTCGRMICSNRLEAA